MFSAKVLLKAAACYEVCRFFLILFSHPLKPVFLLPASWFAAAPLLALPSAFILFMQRGGAHAVVFRRLYALSKAASAAGVAGYIVWALAALRRDSSLAAPYAARHIALMVTLTAADVIAALAALFAARASRRT